MAKKIKVAIAEDHILVRQGMIALLKEEEGLQVVVDAGNGEELLKKLRKSPVDVVLLDIEMPILNGRKTLEYLKKGFPETRVIMISMHYDEAFISEFITNGARGFLPKNCDFDKVVDAIFAVHEQGWHFDNKVSRALLTKLIRSDLIVPVIPSGKLSDREKEILRLSCEEKSTQEIAEIMYLSPRTVEGYRAKIYSKTKSKNIVGLVIYAIRNGIIVI